MNSSYMTRVTLLEKVRDLKDDQAWSEFLNLYRDYIYAVIRSMNIAPHDADDIMQQVSLRLFKSLERYEYDPSRGKFRNWIAVVAKNEVIQFIRKRKQELKVFDPSRELNELDYLDQICLSEIDLIAKEEWDVFTANLALDKVKTQFSESVFSIFLRHLDGESPTEIAEESDMKRQTVYKYISRVKLCFIEELNTIKDK